MNLFLVVHTNINYITMKTISIIKAFLEAGNEYEDFDLEEYKHVYSKLEIEEKKF